MPSELLNHVKTERLVNDTLQLVNTPSPTGDTRKVADLYERLLQDVGCKVERFELIENNPTLVATYGGEFPGKTIIFNGHMDTVTLAHEPASIQGERIYGRGACDMKGSLACIVEVLRVLRENEVKLHGQIVIIANSLHESPGGRGEDLIALAEQLKLTADVAIVMEGATTECTIAQFGSATFEITISREGETSHQLYTPPQTAHPIHVAADIIQLLQSLNVELERDYVEDIGYASYFIGSVHSGQFYNQHPKTAEIVGVRRYSPQTTFAEVDEEFRRHLKPIADKHGVEIDLNLEKVRDGYRLDKSNPAIGVLVQAIQAVRGISVPLVGKKVVTDAGIIANDFKTPALCHGPDQRSAHGDVEYVEIRELELAAKVYLEFIDLYLKN
ncbi:M20 family metallopeptidase [Cohnella silvisoli]|uniref:M20 family metallopeptidase n=1 Tax=Cohnella silvisoli TaxID=2873699 RepID=A0ABV1L3H0_9BACL|nr:M20 family metallopeptidase [Cohnella silvisoli]MCD9026119.1 M20 family metallopeptidase [Cohnella silvisoli]